MTDLTESEASDVRPASDHPEWKGREQWDVFISYRRADARGIADWLHRELVRYRLPVELSPHRHEPLRVFLDVVNERADEDFWNHNVLPNLLAARRLIVMSSPTAREALPGGEPNWLEREVTTYLRERRDPEVSVVIAAGDFDAPLAGGLAERYPHIDRVDLRFSRFSRWFRARTRQRLHEGVITLVAALHRISSSEMLVLRQWEQQQRLRRRLIGAVVTTVVLAVLTVALMAMVFAAVNERREATRSLLLQARAVQREAPGVARLYFAKAVATAESWWPPFARQRAVDARAWLGQRYRQQAPAFYWNDTDWEQDEIDTRRDAFLSRDASSVYVRRLTTGANLAGPLRCEADPTGAYFADDGHVVVADKRSTCVFDTRGRRIGPPVPGEARLSPDGSLAVVVTTEVTGRYSAQLWSVHAGAPVGVPQLFQLSVAPEFSLPSAWALLCGDDRRLLLDASGQKHAIGLSAGYCSGEVIFVADNTRLIERDANGRLLLWDLTTIAPPVDLKGENSPLPPTIDALGRYVAVEGTGGETLIWDARSAHLRARIPFQASSVAFLPGEDARVALVDRDHALHVFNGEHEMPGWPQKVPFVLVDILQASPDGSHLVVGEDETLALWSVNAPQTPVPLRHAEDITHVEFDSTGRKLLTASADGTARLWSVDNGSPLQEPLEHRLPVTGAAFLPDETHVATWSGGALRVWSSAEDNAPITDLGPASAFVVSPQSDPPMVATVTDEGVIRLAQLDGVERGRFVHEGCGPPTGASLDDAIQAGADRYVETLTRGAAVLTFSNDGSLLASWKCGDDAMLWERGSGKVVARLHGHADRVEALAIGAKNDRVLTGSADRTARIWNVASATTTIEPLPHDDAVIAAALSPDELIAATGTISTLQLWNSADGTPKGDAIPTDGSFLKVLEFDGSGDRLLARHAAEVRIYEVGSLRRLMAVELPDVKAAHMDRTGRRVLCASTDNTARIFTVDDTDAPVVTMAHSSDVLDARFCPDERCVVTTTASAVRIWDATTGEPIGPDVSFAEPCTGAAFVSDTSGLVALCKRTRIWPWHPDEGEPNLIMRLAERATGFSLDAAQNSIRLLNRSAWEATSETAD